MKYPTTLGSLTAGRVPHFSEICTRRDVVLVEQKPKSDIPPNIAPKIVTPENYLQICDSSATLIGQLATVTTFGAIFGGIPLSGAYPLGSRHILDILMCTIKY